VNTVTDVLAYGIATARRRPRYADARP